MAHGSLQVYSPIEVSRADIDGAESFEDLGAAIAEILTPDSWLDATEADRRAIALRAFRLMRAWYRLDAGDLAIAPLPSGQLGAQDPTSDTVTVNELLILEDGPDKVLATLAHETRHSFQDAVLNGVVDYPHGEELSGEVALWRSADETYTVLDLVAYMYSPLETDARAAQSGVMIGYWRRLYEIGVERRDA